MTDKGSNEHHLIPSTFKGKETVTLHKVCHDKLHHVFAEREMLHHYHTIERILEHEEIQKFVKWINKQPIDFYTTHRDTKERKRTRRKR